jgi:hypothetical protein
MVRTHPDPPTSSQARHLGAIAQLGERLLCKQEVIGSIPIGSTSFSLQRATQNRGVQGRAILRCALCIGCSLTTRMK